MQSYKHDMPAYRCHYVQMRKGFARVSDEVPRHVGRSTGLCQVLSVETLAIFLTNGLLKLNVTHFL
jgi:hypothetical protein